MTRGMVRWRHAAFVAGFISCLGLGCAFEQQPSPLATVPHDQAEDRSSGQAEPASDVSELLDKELEMSFFESIPSSEVFRRLADVVFGGRVSIEAEMATEISGEFGKQTLRALLDELCSKSHCSWRVVDSPPRLIIGEIRR